MRPSLRALAAEYYTNTLPRATYYRPFGKIGRMGMSPMLLKARRPFRNAIRIGAIVLIVWIYGVHQFSLAVTGQEKFDDVDALLEFEAEREAEEALFEARRQRIEAEGPLRGAYYGSQRPQDYLEPRVTSQAPIGPEPVAAWLKVGLGARNQPSRLIIGAPPIDQLGDWRSSRRAYGVG